MPNHSHSGDNLTVARDGIRAEAVSRSAAQIEPFGDTCLRERGVQLPSRRDDTFKRAAREETSNRQGALDL